MEMPSCEAAGTTDVACVGHCVCNADGANIIDITAGESKGPGNEQCRGGKEEMRERREKSEKGKGRERERDMKRKAETEERVRFDAKVKSARRANLKETKSCCERVERGPKMLR